VYRLEENPRLRLVALSVAILLVAAFVWVAFIRDGDGGPVEPQAMTVSELEDFAADQDHPVYWVGERDDETLEVTRTDAGNVYVRYLPEGVEVGDASPNHPSIGTYPIDDAYEVTEGIADRDDAIDGRTPDGALLVTTRGRPQSIYIAHEGEDVQVEVYDPDAERAIRVASSGDVQPVPTD
jgi:hypothetical protein